jgi:hypothetical protein
MVTSFRSLLTRPWLAPAILAIWLAVVHVRAADVGLLSDSWSMLLAASRPLGEALGHSYRYHTIPVTNLLTLVQWHLFGLVEWPYQLLNLGGVLAVAVVFQRWVRRLTGDGRIGLVAALLWLTNASFFQIVYWPVVGTFQSLGVVLYLLALFAVLDQRPVRFAVFSALAFFTYEPMVSVVGVGLGLVILRSRSAGREAEGDSARPLPAPATLLSLRPWFLAAGAVALAIVLVKAPALLGGGQVASPFHGAAEVEQRLELGARALLAVFTQRGSGTEVERWMGHGLGFDRLTVALVWLLGFAVVGVAAARRGTPVTRFALAWLALHFVVLSLATRIVSRHLYLLALPAALLAATFLVRGGAWLIARGLPVRLAALAGGLVAAVLGLGAATDLGRADRVHERATAAARELNGRLVAAIRRGATVHVADLPARMGGEGVPAFAFLNGTHARLELATPGTFERERLRLWFTRPAPAGQKLFANGSRATTRAQLEEWAAQPSTLVLLWDEKLGRVVELPAPARLPL